MVELANNNALFVLAFLSIFHILGGGALGVALRNIREQPAAGCRSHFGLIIWGLMFGGLPLMMGVAEPLLLVFQLLEIVGALLATLFFWDRIRELLGRTNVMLTLFGGIFFAAGCAAAGFLIKEKEWFMALLFGGLFGGVGAVVLSVGIKQTLNPPADSDE